MVELKVTDEQRREALRRALLGGGKARVELTSGQRQALAKATPAPSSHARAPQESAASSSPS